MRILKVFVELRSFCKFLACLELGQQVIVQTHLNDQHSSKHHLLLLNSNIFY